MAIRHFGHNRTSLYISLMLSNSSAISFSVILPEACRRCISCSGVRHCFPGWHGLLQNEQKIKEHFGHCALLFSSSKQPITHLGLNNI
uniref:Uncharacterized protein n=1 Tax=Arundo donax TaxID=35708 RepID=A0A0A8ZI40_ARUDO